MHEHRNPFCWLGRSRTIAAHRTASAMSLSIFSSNLKLAHILLLHFASAVSGKNLRVGEQILILFIAIPVLAGSKTPFCNIFRCTAWLMVQGRLQVATHNDTSSSEYLLPQQEAANPTQQASSSTLSKQTLCLHFPRDQSSSASVLCFVQK